MCNAAKITLIAVLVCWSAAAVGDDFTIDTKAVAKVRLSNAATVEPNLITGAIHWISSNSVLPSTKRFPEINLIPAETIAAHRRSLARLGFQQGTLNGATDSDGDIFAFYDRNTATIYLDDDWKGDTPVEMSILVHEMVHHMEAMLEIRGHIGRRSERHAYNIQDRWLSAHGTNLLTAFNIDPFSTAMLTEWLY